MANFRYVANFTFLTLIENNVILFQFDIGHSILLSGTPIQNNLKELYALLCLVAPKIFREKHSTEFEEYFADVKDTQGKVFDPFVSKWQLRIFN